MTTKAKIRAALRECRPYGATSDQIATRTNVNSNLVRVTLRNMDDAYIYKWTVTEAGHGYVAVWKCVPVPENAARPTIPAPKPRRVYDAAYRERKKAKTRKAEQPIEIATGVRTQIRGPWPTHH